MRAWLRKWVPKNWRVQYRLWRRYAADRRSGLYRQFAAEGNPPPDWPRQLEVSQPIFASQLSENKVHNIQLAARSLSRVVVRPGEVFSFWRLVGPARPDRGFKPGRNLENGELVAGYGGGLCQLAGIVYHLSLLAGLEVLERHAHSVDIYEEHERYAPLGSDATVVFPFKDLRLRNPYSFAVQFSFVLRTERLTAFLHCEQPLRAHRLRFERQATADYWTVSTWMDEQLLTKSRYRKKNF